MAKLSNLLGTILLLLILANVAPRLIKGIKEQYQNLLKPRTKVARMKIEDIIYDISSYRKHLESFFKNKEIKAILLEIDSGGGAAGSSQALYNEIIRLKQMNNKPIVSLSYNICASGAYNVAIATDYIIASPSAIIGSVGSYINMFKVTKLMEKVGVDYEIEKTGTYKSALNFFTLTTPEQKIMLQKLSDDAYQQFVQDVACRRKLPLNTQNEWANGRVFTGNQALKLKLIDEVGSEFNATQKIKELALIDREIEWVKPPKPTLLQTFMGTDNDDTPMLLTMIKNALGISSKMNTPMCY